MLEEVLCWPKNPLQRPPKKADWEGRNIKNYLLLRQQRKGSAQAIANRRAD